MKKFNKPEIELIVLDNTDICTASVFDVVATVNYNMRGIVNLTELEQVEELEETLE